MGAFLAEGAYVGRGPGAEWPPGPGGSLAGQTERFTANLRKDDDLLP